MGLFVPKWDEIMQLNVWILSVLGSKHDLYRVIKTCTTVKFDIYVQFKMVVPVYITGA